MAKRFTDSGKWRKTWFSELSLEARLTWLYLLDNCDEAGIWDANFRLASFELGFQISPEILNQWFGEKLTTLAANKLWISSFVKFQYGKELSEACKPHQKVISILQEYGIDIKTLTLPDRVSDTLSSTLKEEEEDKDKDQEKEKEEEEETPNENNRVSNLRHATEELCTLWASVLEHYGGERALLETEREKIARAIQLHGAQAVRLAFLGQRYEPASDDFKPNRHLSLARIFNPQKFERFVSLGAQADKKLKARAEQTQREQTWNKATA